MKPWCAEGEVPTAANLNLYQGWRSCLGWHCDDEPLFGECGEAKLIVSVSFGSSAVFKWRRQSCPDVEGHFCWLGHGDILVMDGQCQDEFLDLTDPGREQERINVTFRWIKQHVLSCPLFEARRFISSCYGDCGEWRFGVLFSLQCLVHIGDASFFGVLLFVYKAWVTSVCLLLDTPFRRRSVGALPW